AVSGTAPAPTGSPAAATVGTAPGPAAVTVRAEKIQVTPVVDDEDEPELSAPAGRRASTKGLGRRSLDSLRVGVLVLDAEDRPVLANPAAREMGLLRPGTVNG